MSTPDIFLIVLAAIAYLIIGVTFATWVVRRKFFTESYGTTEDWVKAWAIFAWPLLSLYLSGVGLVSLVSKLAEAESLNPRKTK